MRAKTGRYAMGLVAAAALSVICLPLTARGATADAEQEQHCVVQVVGQQPDGEFITTSPVCYPTFEKVLDRVAAIAAWNSMRLWDVTADDAQSGGAAVSGTFILGTHYEYPNRGGSSFTVVGSDCAGGYLNLGVDWNDRVSSTKNGCPIVRHWENAYLQGRYDDTLSPGGNLDASLDDETSSIQYLR